MKTSIIPTGPPDLSMTPTPLDTQNYDPEAVRAKYLAERDKRLVAGRADIRDLGHDEYFARYRDDPFTPGDRARAGRRRGRRGHRRAVVSPG